MLTKCSFLTGYDIPKVRELFSNNFTGTQFSVPNTVSTISYRDSKGNYYAAILKRGEP